MRWAALTIGLMVAFGFTACSKSGSGPPADFDSPTSVVAYSGRTAQYSGEVRTYLAIASSGSSGLRIVDPSDDSVLFGPGAVFSLSVPTLPRPVLLASASLADDVGSARKAGLLVAASTGSLELQVMSTWTVEPLLAYTVDLSTLAGTSSAEILALAGAPVPGTSDGAVAGRARIVVALSGGRLAIVEFERGADGSINLADGMPVLATLDQSLEVDPVSIAVAPDNVHYYLATPDAIPDAIPPEGGSRFGVVEVTASGDPVADIWPLGWLDASAPTRAVAVAEVQERLDTPVDGDEPSTNYYDVAALRVYAVLDAEGCGQLESINCGVVTLDPATRTITPDIATAQTTLGPNQPALVPAQTYRAPIYIPGMALDIAIAFPPSVASDQVRTQLTDSAELEMALAPSTGQLWTSACAAVTSSDGRTYVVDLARSNTPDDVSFLAGGDMTAVTNGESNAPFQAPTLLFYDKSPDEGGTLVGDMTTGVQLTPGYTDTDTWSIIWQGELPWLASRPAVISQVDGNTHAEISGVDPTQPSLGVHVGDIVEIVPDAASSSCSASEAKVAGRDSAAQTLLLGSIDSCLVSRLSGGPISAAVTIRAQGLVLVGASTGYAGRPELDEPFALQWSDESVDCAEDWDCEEAKVLSRKARRRYYPWNPQCEGNSCVAFWPDLVTGPALAFRVGSSPSTGSGLVRDSAIVFKTKSGVVPMSRGPSRGSLPTHVISLDRSVFSEREGKGTTFYVTHLGNMLFEFTPGLSASDVVEIN